MNPEEPNYNEPVAYDKDGRPLYAHPPKDDQASQQVVHITRAIEPLEPELSPEAKRRHQESVQKHPTLNLSNGEYIISEVRRHPIGLLLPILTGGALVFLVLLGLVAYPSLVPTNNPPFESIILPAILMLILI